MRHIDRAAPQFSQPAGIGLAASCIGLIVGIALQLQQRELDAQLLYALLAGAGLLTMLGSLRLSARRSGLAPTLAFLAFLLATALVGYGSTGWRATAYQAGSLAPALEGRDIAVTGVVLAMPQRSDDGVRFRFGVESAELDGEVVSLPRQIQLGWYAGFAARESVKASDRSAGPLARAAGVRAGVGVGAPSPQPSPGGRGGKTEAQSKPDEAGDGSQAGERGGSPSFSQEDREQDGESGGILRQAQDERGSEAHDRGGNLHQQGPRDWLSQTAGAAAPPGLEPAAPKLLEQLRTGDRGDASREPRPARPRELREANDRGGSPAKQGPRDWLRQTAGAAAPPGGRELREANDRGGHIHPGERWQFTLRLKAPHGNSNPHGFDYELWLWEQGLQAAGYVRTGAKDAVPLRLSTSWSHPVERARQAARDAIFERVQDRQLAGIVAALVVGDQNAIERADWDVFRATGVAHLMSISGLHITMFAWLAALLIGAVWRRSARWSPALCLWLPASTAGAFGGLLLATGYALFSGWGVPAQRTICMLAVVVLLRLGGRRWPWPQTWLTAMAVVLAFDPWAMLQAGFWLSFVAVGILFAAAAPAGSGADPADADRLDGPGFAIKSGAISAPSDWAASQSGFGKPPKQPFLLRVLRKLSDLLRQALREQWTVTLALTPLSLLLFNQMSLVGLPANLLAIPWVTLVVTPLAMLGLVWAPLWDAAAWAISVLALFLQTLAAWPGAALDVPAAPLLFAVAGVAGGALLALRLPWHWRLLGLPLLLPVLLWQTPRVAAGEFELLAADIGQGNAVLVRTARHALLYDTGPRFSRESDAGHRVLVPLLRAIGEPLDTLVLSHRDLDHVGGAAAVLAMQPQAALLASIEDSHELQALKPATRCVAGQRWDWDGVHFEILHPLATDYDAAAKSNAMSCVLRISNGSRTALLTGDLEAPQEARLLASGAAAQLKADFLLVPHHGSKTSSSAAWLDAVQPRFALVQAGYRNRYGHPAASVMARYDERGIKVVRSPSCGAARWRSAEPAELDCQREQSRRYWQHRVSP